MPNLKILSPARSRQYAGRKGLGIRAFCKAASQNASWGLGPQLVALRNIQGPQIVTNAIVGSHSESAGGFVEADSGLRDSGSIEFDANFVPEYAGWQDFNDRFSFANGENRVPVSFMGGLFGISGQQFNRKGNELEDPTAHLYELSIAMPNTLTLIHCYGFPSMFGPMIGAMESIIMSQFSFKISGAPSMLRPLLTIRYTSSFAAGAVAASKAAGGPMVTMPGRSTSAGFAPAISFGADTSGDYGTLSVVFDAVTLTAITRRDYNSANGKYMARLVYPGEYEMFSDLKDFDGTGALTFGGGANSADWPLIDRANYKDNFEEFRKVMGTAGSTRKAGMYVILYRAEWEDED